MERWHPKVVKPKMTGRKLRVAVHWQGALKQGGVKQGSRVHIVRPRVMPLTEKSRSYKNIVPIAKLICGKT